MPLPKHPPPHPTPPMIVVRPPPTSRERFFRIIGRIAYWILRILFLLVIFVLCSIGITALINEPIREILMTLIQ